MSFGRIIVDARRKAQISQKQLAARIKKEDGSQISPQYLNDIERDRRNPPSEYFIRQFAKKLDLSEEYLILAAGTLPSDVRASLTDSDPRSVVRAFRAFRKNIK
jgi:transcriptional regulator with XRE-family HTH domain